eukprot:4132544-Amphidinium_carterae.2
MDEFVEQSVHIPVPLLFVKPVVQSASSSFWSNDLAFAVFVFFGFFVVTSSCFWELYWRVTIDKVYLDELDFVHFFTMSSLWHHQCC